MSCHMANLGEDEFEEWFLAGLSAEPIPLEEMLCSLDELRRAGMGSQADSWAELLEDTLVDRGLGDSLVRAVRARAASRESDSAFRLHVEKRLEFVFRNDPLRRKFVANAGFDKALNLKECFRRLDTLLNLKEGVLGLDKTWGIGRVRAVDAFYEKVTIDFARKRGHEMSFAYAAEAIQFVQEDHLQAMHFLDPAGLQKLVTEKPADVVKIALRSHGNMPVARLQEILVVGIVAPDSWKLFWDSARRILKDDPLVVIPARRSDAIQLLDREVSYDAHWFKVLANERTADAILGRIEEVQAAMDPALVDDSGRRIVADRLQFLLKGFGDSDLALRVQVVLCARQWGLPEGWLPWRKQMDGLIVPEVLLSAVTLLSTKKIDALLGAAVEHDPKKLMDALLLLLPRVPAVPLNVLLDFMIERGAEAECGRVFREELGRRQAGVEMVLWLVRHPEKFDAWNVGTPGDLMFHILPLFERMHTGERLKAANQLGEMIQQRKWLEYAVETMTEVQQTSLIRSLRSLMGRVPLDTQAMIGRICIARPELARILEGTQEEPVSARGGMTSWRSYHARQRQLDKLINEEIPKNSKDIGVARSYGDLRENFEYKAAKEQQGILMRRRAEWEQGLQQVRGTDFASCMAHEAGMGTTVSLRHADGKEHVFHILGEWDQEPKLGIISCSSKMGRALAGRRAGDPVVVPDEAGDVEAVVVKVEGLPAAVLGWAKGEPS